MPFDTRKMEQLLDHEVLLQKVQDLGLDLGFLSPARDLFLPELHRFEDHFLIANQIINRDTKRVGERDQDTRTGHRFVALVFPDCLSRHAVSNSLL